MAQASSAQREPSMEEILASIRRIIEDNDTGRRPAVDFEQMRPEPEDDRGDRNIIEVEAFRAEFQAAKAAPVEVKPAEITPVVAKQEAPRRDEPVKWPSAEPKVAVATAMPLRPTVAETPVPVVETPAAARPSAASWAPQSTIAVEQMERLAGPREAEKPAPQVVAQVVTKVAEPAVADEPVAQKPAIISEQAGRQISAAFGELNDAYAARSRKSFDDIATEMLRPMLQDWLDNNLPTLVERLVREEIERVARGAQ
ncbi:PopZ family protein [Aminobacter aminovorans]|uniref:PopZ family protein n=1 Tax=Aminobacter aminovorans TaxID=83263 RepID=UPI002858A3FC|nr:PopZ family protein [Aminobacter aminovorans]MDR7225052.1 cell pole-organizing protein PopZ [Aminobacter aminovorans]